MHHRIINFIDNKYAKKQKFHLLGVLSQINVSKSLGKFKLVKYLINVIYLSSLKKCGKWLNLFLFHKSVLQDNVKANLSFLNLLLILKELRIFILSYKNDSLKTLMSDRVRIFACKIHYEQFQK